MARKNSKKATLGYWEAKSLNDQHSQEMAKQAERECREEECWRALINLAGACQSREQFDEFVQKVVDRANKEIASLGKSAVDLATSRA